MGSFPAVGVKLENMGSATRDIFMDPLFGKISGDFNFLPLMSLIKGEQVWKVTYKAAMDNAGTNIDMEDSWKTFFSVASNFTTH